MSSKADVRRVRTFSDGHGFAVTSMSRPQFLDCLLSTLGRVDVIAGQALVVINVDEHSPSVLQLDVRTLESAPRRVCFRVPMEDAQTFVEHVFQETLDPFIEAQFLKRYGSAEDIWLPWTLTPDLDTARAVRDLAESTQS